MEQGLKGFPHRQPKVTAGGGLPPDGNYTDITVSGAGGIWLINNGVVTFAKFQNISTDRLIGRDTAGSGSPEEIQVSGGLEFTGSSGIQRSALTGEVTATAGSNVTVLDKTAITNKANVTPELDDTTLISDTSDTGNLKEITLQQLSTLINPDGLTQGKMVAAIGGWAHQ